MRTQATSPAATAALTDREVTMSVSTTTAPATITEARLAALYTFGSDDRVTAVYYDLPFGQIVVTRDSTAYLADEYDAGLVGR